ncbi:MAG: glutamate-1-semialdehyde 2,1-aminomutase [Candidatus Omnitrophica bacterium]|nr:glutamate-1-semialdehyde 2,1-aminomutase [Candidatus Omnitrophota bacterium]
MKNNYSKKYFNQAKDVLVGGVNSPVRSFHGVGGQPLVMKYGQGSRFYDYDGNGFTDYCLSWGSLILGHAHRNIVLAAKKTVQKGVSFGTTTREEIALAEKIVGCVPSVQKIRFVNSGTEATMSAIRLARGYTKRSKIIKFDGCYHGHVDDLLTTAGSGVAQLPESSSQGIPKAHVQNTFSLPYNDEETLKDTIKTHHDDIACVILEPVAGNMGVIPATKAFLKTLREWTHQYGIVLIFDEIMTGFRSQAGCVQSDFGIIPDMTCLGKIIGGGFSIGAYGGSKEIMRHLAPEGGVYQAGTFSGNPVVMSAGFAALQLLTPEFYQALNTRSEETARKINEAFAENHIGAHLVHYKSMMSLRFRKEPVLDYQDARSAAGGKTYADLFYHLLERGIYLPPADLEAFFISGMHSKKEMNDFVEGLTSFFIK